MREWAEYTIENDGGRGAVLALRGPLVVASVGPLDQELRKLDQQFASVDLSGIKDIDTVGAWTAWRIARDHDAQIVGANETARRLIEAVQSNESAADIAPPRIAIIERVPEAVGQLVT